MSDWTDGYVAEIDYTYGYYGELSPLRIAVPFLNVGLMPPPIETACELGFGQGISVNVHAAASPVRWWGNDFNPAQAGFAQSLAQAAASGAQLFEQSFAEFCGRGDLPDFDFIGLHGILSWISEDNHRVIVDFIRRKLKPGGVLFTSYNCQPGNAAVVPFRRLLLDHVKTMTAPGAGIVARLEAALQFADRLIGLNPRFAVANPVIAERLKLMREQNRSYLVHEYLNRDWRAMPFAEMAHSLVPAKLTFAASGAYSDHIPALNLTTDQNRILGEIPDPVFRETVRDFIVNQQFRRDYWVKGARRLSPIEQLEALRRLRVMLITAPRSRITLTASGALGQRELNPDLYNRVLDALEGYEPRTLGEIENAFGGTGVPLPAIFEAVMLLLGKGDLGLVQDEAAQTAAQPHTDRLNRRLLERARGPGSVGCLASPVVGGGVGVTQVQQLFLLEREHAGAAPEQLARSAWEVLAALNQRLTKDGKALETAEENLAELAVEAGDFVEHRLPLYRALKLID